MKQDSQLFGTEKISKILWKMAPPVMLAQLIQALYNIVDSFFVGRYSESGLTALSIIYPIQLLMIAFAVGTGVGINTCMAHYLGLSEDEKADEIGGIGTPLTLFMWAVFAVFCYFFMPAYAKMSTDSAEVIKEVVMYGRIVCVFSFGLFLESIWTKILQANGNMKTPMIAQIAGAVTNIILDPLLIFGMFGLPKMGIAGAALGTLIARLFEAGMICGYLLLKDEKIGFRVKHLGMKTADLLGEYIRISIPVLISDGILAIGNNTVAMVIGRLGVTFVAANAITSVTQQLSTVMIQGVCQAGAIVTGQTLGEGKQEQAQSQAYRFLGLGLGLGMLSAFFIMAVSPAIIGSYKVSEETAEVAAQLMHAISLILIFQATNSIMTKGVLRGGGDTKMLMLADNLFLWVVSIPLGMLAGFVFHFPAFWIYVCLKADQILKAVWCVFRLRSGKWMKKITVGKVSGQEDRA